MAGSTAIRMRRADLARALDDMARADRRLAGALTACEAWESGYCSELVNLAVDLSAQDDPAHQSCSSARERALQAVSRAIDITNPRYRARALDHSVDAAAVQALLGLLTSQARFHEAATSLDRRRWHRVPTSL
jgi:hypothetical protein